MKQIFTILFSLICLVKISQGARILVVFAIPGGSHYKLGSSLVRGLLEHGFEVTMITPFEMKNPPKNYSEVLLTGLTEKFQDILKGDQKRGGSMFEWDNMPVALQIHVMNTMGSFLTENTLSHPNTQKLLKSKQKFDAVIIEQFCNDGLKMLAYHFNAPLIVSSSMGSNVWISTINGVPEPPSYLPDIFLNYGTKMNFLQRAHNFFIKTLHALNFHFVTYKSQNEIAKKYFPNYPDLDVVLYNTSLVLLNSHESINIAMPYVPNMVNIGGYHVTPPNALPKDLKEFMDSATNGVIYFSLGSNLVPSDMPNKTQEIILKVLGSRNEKVLWKWDQEILENKPENVMISKWFPQQNILAHPNIKLFITHCGLLSITETIYHGVPILGLPVFGDQQFNALRAETLGFGKAISFLKITEKDLKHTLNELLGNSKYKENAQYRSRVFHDRPQKPMDAAVYWINYVIRHKGAPHLRIAGIDLPLYQYLMLDVLAAFLGTALLMLYVSAKMFRICCKKSNKSKQKLKEI